MPSTRSLITTFALVASTFVQQAAAGFQYVYIWEHPTPTDLTHQLGTTPAQILMRSALHMVWIFTMVEHISRTLIPPTILHSLPSTLVSLESHL